MEKDRLRHPEPEMETIEHRYAPDDVWRGRISKIESAGDSKEAEDHKALVYFSIHTPSGCTSSVFRLVRCGDGDCLGGAPMAQHAAAGFFIEATTLLNDQKLLLDGATCYY